MKKLILAFALVLLNSAIYAQELNSNASYIKKNYPSEYEQTLKKYALIEWKDDFTMVVYDINKQSDALMALIAEFKSDNTKIAIKAIQEWSREGFLSKNITVLNEITTFGLKDLLKLHCDWSMVKYEYDKQLKAKNSF